MRKKNSSARIFPKIQLHGRTASCNHIYLPKTGYLLHQIISDSTRTPHTNTGYIFTPSKCGIFSFYFKDLFKCSKRMVRYWTTAVGMFGFFKVHGRNPCSCTGSGNLVPSINLCSRLCEISEFSVHTTCRCDVSTACGERLEISPNYYDTSLPNCSEEFVVNNNIYHKYTYKCIILYQINDYWRRTKTRKK